MYSYAVLNEESYCDCIGTTAERNTVNVGWIELPSHDFSYVGRYYDHNTNTWTGDYKNPAEHASFLEQLDKKDDEILNIQAQVIELEFEKIMNGVI